MTNSPYTPRVLLLNGPPRSGKDALGQLLADLSPDVRVMKFAQPLIDTMSASFGVSCADGADKEAPCAVLGGRSRRETAISLSENWFKPTFGDDVFGKILLAKINALPVGAVAVVTDSGFKSEAQPIIAAMPPGAVEMLHIDRFGCSFENDSRGYWTDDRVTMRMLKNNGFISKLELEAKNIINPWRWL
jgi:hypothetical protein